MIITDAAPSAHPDQKLASALRDAFEKDQRKFRQGYISPDERARSSEGFEQCAKRLSAATASCGLAVPSDTAAEIVSTTLQLNPNASLSSDGRYKVRTEHKRYLLESLIKAVIGNVPCLSPGSFTYLASLFSRGEFFAEGERFPRGEQILTEVPKLPGKEAGEAEGTRWTPEHGSDVRIGAYRSEVAGALRRVITSALEQYTRNPGSGKNLEIAAGWGDFRWLAPGYFTQRCIHTDWNPFDLVELQGRFPGARTSRENAYDLQFPDESFDNAVVLTSLVSLPYLDAAISELWRVMKPGARFFSFQDLLANDIGVSRQLSLRGMVPANDGEWWFLSEYDRDNGEEAFSGPGTSARADFNSTARVQNLHEYFDVWLVNELQYRGFHILERGCREEVHASVEIQSLSSRVFHQGFPPGPYMEDHQIEFNLPVHDRILKRIEHVFVWTTVAEKPCLSSPLTGAEFSSR